MAGAKLREQDSFGTTTAQTFAMLLADVFVCAETGEIDTWMLQIEVSDQRHFSAVDKAGRIQPPEALYVTCRSKRRLSGVYRGTRGQRFERLQRAWMRGEKR
jgi:hypothetical protein